MALSQLQVNVLRTVAESDAVPVSVLVGCQQEEPGRGGRWRARRSRVRYDGSGGLERELRGRRASLTLGHSTAWLTAQRKRSVSRLVWWHLKNGSTPSGDRYRLASMCGLSRLPTWGETSSKRLRTGVSRCGLDDGYSAGQLLAERNDSYR